MATPLQRLAPDAEDDVIEARRPFDEVDALAANALRVLAMDAVQQANSGHPGMPMGAADMAYVLWTRFLRHNPANPRWPDRDRFVRGYDLPLEEITRFRQWGSRTPATLSSA